MSEEIRINRQNTNNVPENDSQVKSDTGNKNFDINESNYRIQAPRENGPSVIGRGGDPLYRTINASKDQIEELLKETETIQDWVNRESGNNVAINCLENENLRELFNEFKNGFGEYGRVSLMGFKNPQGVEIPRLKIFDKEDNVIDILTGYMAIVELNKRDDAYRESLKNYEEIPHLASEAVSKEVIEDYSGNPDDYTT